MNLPIVLEIAVGLIFIYLTLSLVASEIQEILSALFQWRAEHLKRSIEQLLAGDVSQVGNRDESTSTSATNSQPTDNRPENRSERRTQAAAGRVSGHADDREAAKALANRLYDSPLIANLNYEAQGRITGFLRSLLHGIGACYRFITFSRNVFGNHTSGPSYIPAETFATSLLERLKLEDFQQLLVRSRFGEFVRTEVRIPLHNMVNELRARLRDEDLLLAEMVQFDQKLNQIVKDLETHRLTLEDSLQEVDRQLQSFETMAKEDPSLYSHAETVIVQTFLNRLHYLRNAIGSPDNAASSTAQATTADPGSNTAALIARIRPSLSDLMALLDPNSPTYAELVALSKREGGAVLQAFEKLQSEVIPPRLRASLMTLGKRAETRLRATHTKTSSELQALQTEVETWFNHGMQRASGVYRRNVKGVGLLIGLAIAFTLNADTFYMFERLSSDPAIRSSIIQTAQQLDVESLTSAEEAAEALSIDELSEQIENDLRSVSSAVEKTLADYPLPIGRSPVVLNAQLAAEEAWPVPFIPQRFVGWSITALALSMGASFWFDLLRKVMAVRSSGNPPKKE